jgi:adenylate kinase
VRQWLQTYGENGFILDGYPRSIGQAVSLERMLEEANRPLVAVIGLNCFEGTMRDRISRRVQCVACPYSGTPSSSHAVEEVNQNGARCPDCGEELLRRADDSQEAFSTRLNLYENLTAPLFEHYAAKQLLLEVDGEQSIDAVEAKILGALNWQCSVSCEDKAA